MLARRGELYARAYQGEADRFHLPLCAYEAFQGSNSNESSMPAAS